MDNIIPHNTELEEAILASCLKSVEDLEELTGLIKPSDFYLTKHQIIYSAMLRLHQQNEAVNAVTICQALIEAGELEKAGGGVFISSLLDIPGTMDCEYYAGKMRGYEIRRRIIEAGNAIMKYGYRNDLDPEAGLDKAQALILGITGNFDGNESHALSDLIMDASDRLVSLQQRSCDASGITTGFTDFDRSTCGFQNSDLIILAARPSMGKTALAVNMAFNSAKKGHSCGIFSLEMSKEAITNRFLAVRSGVNLLKFQSGKFSHEDWEKITQTQKTLYELKIQINDTPALSYGELRRKARRMKQKHGIEILFVDYLQLMQGDKQNGRVEEISSVSRNMKACAKELGIPVVVLSQLNRSLETRDNKRPRLFDLRDSGAIEQDADLVAFIYRDEVYYHDTKNKGIAEIIIAKQRNGPTGTIVLTWDERTTKFSNHQVTNKTDF